MTIRSDFAKFSNHQCKKITKMVKLYRFLLNIVFVALYQPKRHQIR